MKCVILDEPNSFRLDERDVPDPGPGEALVRMVRMGICGTDLHAFQGDQPFFSYPRIIGHELAGEIAAVGDGVDGFATGDPVVVLPYLACKECIACRRGRPNCCERIQVMGVHVDGGLQEYVPVPADHLIPAPGLDWDRRALVECLSIGAHAVRRADPEDQENVLVIGAGPIGLGVLQFARQRGARTIALDLNSERLRFWTDQLGGGDVVGPDDDAPARIRELCGGDMPTCVVDATGHVGSMCGALDFVAHGGRLVYVGISKEKFGWNHPEFHMRETTLLASRNATREDFVSVMDSLRDGVVQASCFVTHRTSIDDIVGRFESYLDPATKAVKALIEF